MLPSFESESTENRGVQKPWVQEAGCSGQVTGSSPHGAPWSWGNMSWDMLARPPEATLLALTEQTVFTVTSQLENQRRAEHLGLPFFGVYHEPMMSQLGTSTSLFVCASLDSSLTPKSDTNTWGFIEPLDSWLRGSLRFRNFCCCQHWFLMFQ